MCLWAVQGPLDCSDPHSDHVYSLMHFMGSHTQPRWHMPHITGEAAATAALAMFADCGRPAHIVVLVDHVLQLSTAAASPAASLWALSLVRLPPAPHSPLTVVAV